MNTADPLQSVMAALWSDQMGVANAGSYMPAVPEAWWNQSNGSYVGGAVSTTTQAGATPFTVTGSNFGGAVSTTTQAGATPFTVTGSYVGGAVSTTTQAGATPFTVTGSNFGGAVSTWGITNPDRPVARPLEVRRFYHWNKSATAGAAGTPGTTDPPGRPQEEDLAHRVPAVLVFIAEEREAIGVTESEAVQITEHGRRRGNRRRPVRGTVLAPRSLTRVAVILAGQKRSAVGEEWRGHLLGESDHGLTQREQIRAARGFVWAAVRYRLGDAADLAWRADDAVLRSHTLSNLAIWVPVLLAVLAIVRHDGLYGLVTYDINLMELGGGIYGAIRFGRHRRGVKPLKRRPGQVKE